MLKVKGPGRLFCLNMSDDADELTSQGDALTTQYAVKAKESVLWDKTLFDSPAGKSQVKRCPSCESVVSKGSRHSSGGWLDTPEIVSALGQLTDQLTQLAWNGNFKRLKVFSGTDPVPTDEESFESWRDSTVVSVRDWTGPETTMRRKILESLNSPAMDVVKSYMVGHPDATSGDLIEVLELTFGPVESAPEMLHRFHSTFQKEKEDLSVYLVRLEQGLRLLVSRGAITNGEIDPLRIRQLKRGTLNSDPVAMTIRAHNQDKLPSGYIALMERVWREEADAYVRVRRSPTTGHTEKSPADAKLLKKKKKLRKELEELKAQLSERARPPQLRLRKFLSVTSVPNCPVPDEGETQSALCKVRHRRRNFYGRCYKCQVMGHQAQNCKTYKNFTVQISYYEPSICESDSPEEDKVLSREKTTVENPIGMKVVPETSDTPDRSKGLGLARSLPVCPRGEYRGQEESFPCLSSSDIIQPSCMLDSDPIGWEPQCILGKGGVPDFGAKSTGSPRERAERAGVSSCKTVRCREEAAESGEIEPSLSPAKLLQTQKEKGATSEIVSAAELCVISSVKSSVGPHSEEGVNPLPAERELLLISKGRGTFGE
ncbi:hypothetical protein XELAEV_18018960mg [Xenopus laevis]|uniref:CCHC-type domain-containing protein n=1 Tax=Xenopus laevis TaxID=8355 RepID=A0A974HU91_XENLA|nr:hypothetical protein XELAEV_18018960mg [Xenopus laevis]